MVSLYFSSVHGLIKKCWNTQLESEVSLRNLFFLLPVAIVLKCKGTFRNVIMVYSRRYYYKQMLQVGYKLENVI